jgi:hypothetical protein
MSVVGPGGGGRKAPATTRSAPVIRRVIGVDRGRTAAAVPNITSCSVTRTGGCGLVTRASGCDRSSLLTVGWVPVMASCVASMDSPAGSQQLTFAENG